MERVFICDKCGKPIKDLQNGWVEWIRTENDSEIFHHGLRIVHKLSENFIGVRDAGCKYNENQLEDNSIVEDMALSSFLGENGAQSLIHLFSKYKFSKDEFICFVKRILIPRYDELILCLPEAKEMGIVDNNDWDLYSIEQINIIIDKVNSLEK